MGRWEEYVRVLAQKCFMTWQIDGHMNIYIYIDKNYQYKYMNTSIHGCIKTSKTSWYLFDIWIVNWEFFNSRVLEYTHKYVNQQFKKFATKIIHQGKILLYVFHFQGFSQDFCLIPACACAFNHQIIQPHHGQVIGVHHTYIHITHSEGIKIMIVKFPIREHNAMPTSHTGTASSRNQQD